MITCESMSDRMPLVAAGRVTWTEEETAHLAGCDDCRLEWELVAAAPHLGEREVRRQDPARITAGALGRLRSARQRDRWRRVGTIVGLAAAATVALVVWRGSTPSPRAPGVVAESGFALPQAELDGLDEGQLQAVLDGLDAPLGGEGGDPTPSLDRLDNDQLERVLRSLEG